MKTPFYVLGLAALFAGSAMAGDTPKADAPRGMQSDKDGDGRVSRAEATSCRR